jgi:multidrug resistance efflux pump
MNHKRPPLPAIIVIGLLVIVSVYFLVSQGLSKKNGALTASGVIEAVQVNVAPELAGKVTEVNLSRRMIRFFAWTRAC